LESGVDAYLVLVGRKLPEIEVMIKAAGDAVAARVRLAGFVTHDNIPPYLALMDIAVLPNTQAYCSPLKLFEYMAMAKACLAPSTSTINSIIKNGEEGILFDPESDLAFTNGLIHLAKDKDLCRRLGQAARARVEHEFTWDHNAQRVMQLLEDGLAWKDKMERNASV
jgi:glycosyltransferase involved in cell wall biosynthesis